MQCSLRIHAVDTASWWMSLYGTEWWFVSVSQVDYRGYEVTVENFIRVLTGRLPPSTPRSKRLLSDNRSNIVIYMTGHGGDGFLKFQVCLRVLVLSLLHCILLVTCCTCRELACCVMSCELTPVLCCVDEVATVTVHCSGYVY